MINDLTDEIFWLFAIGVCILFAIRLLSPPPAERDAAANLLLRKPRRRSRRRALRNRWLAEERAK
ncbi:MAG: hypothetical protein J0H18_00195 [Rhizobiales bacterium]|nr:hypothetical protein [Hyphomicrobiales bacterium]OJY02517.1 MAG: hypothetical protein BGP07_11450 [Rhizobiales bacterium 63-22]